MLEFEFYFLNKGWFIIIIIIIIITGALIGIGVLINKTHIRRGRLLEGGLNRILAVLGVKIFFISLTFVLGYT